MTQLHRTRTKVALWAYVALVLVAVVLPVAYAFSGAFRGRAPAVWWENFIPVDFTLENFALAFQLNPLGTQIFNSMVVTFFQTSLEVLTAILAAAALVFGRLRRPNWFFAFMLITMMIPGESIIVAKFLLISNTLSLYDTLPAIFLPYMVSAFSIFLLRQRFLSFPREIYEASQIEGASPLRFVFQILVPLNRPAIFMVTINAAIGAWNGYLWPLVITERPTTRTLQVGISQLADAEALNLGVILAGVVIVSIPMILLILTGNKYLTRGLTEGASK